MRINIQQLKSYNRFYHFLFQITFGFLHKILAKILWAVTNKEKFQAFHRFQLDNGKLQWRVFNSQLYLAIMGESYANDVLQHPESRHQINISIKSAPPDPVDKLLAFVHKEDLGVMIDFLKDNKISVGDNKIILNNNQIEKIDSIRDSGKDKEIRQGKSCLTFKEYDEIMRGQSNLTVSDIKELLKDSSNC